MIQVTDPRHSRREEREVTGGGASRVVRAGESPPSRPTPTIMKKTETR